jgi:hypothetical protein
VQARSERDFDAVFATLAGLRAGALVIIPDSLFTSRRERLGALASRHAVPAIAPYREFAAAGGLMSYGTNITNLFRQVGVLTSRILKGVRPESLDDLQQDEEWRDRMDKNRRAKTNQGAVAASAFGGGVTNAQPEKQSALVNNTARGVCVFAGSNAGRAVSAAG